MVHGSWFISRLLVNDSKLYKNIHAICCVIFIVHMIVNFDLLIAMLLNNCCKIILLMLSCNSAIDVYIHEEVCWKFQKRYRKDRIFLCKSEPSIELTGSVFGYSDTRFMRCLYRCTQMWPCFLYFAMQTKNAVDI